MPSTKLATCDSVAHRVFPYAVLFILRGSFTHFRLPSHSACGSFFIDIFKCDGCLSHCCTVALSSQRWGHYFKLGWKPLNTPGTQLPFSDVFVNGTIRWIMVGYIQVTRPPNLDLFVEGFVTSKE